MEPIIAILVVFLILFAIYWAVGKFGLTGVPYQVIGVVLAIVFVLYALNRFGIGFGSVHL